MDNAFWLERWKRNEIGFHQLEINTHLQEFWGSLDLSAGNRVFVPLCGKSRDMLWLRAQGYRLLGVEISPIAVHDFYIENRLVASFSRDDRFERWETDQLVILTGDFFDLTAKILEDIAGVYDRASLVAFPPERRNRYAIHLQQILPPEAEILLVTMEYPQNEMQGPPFSVHEDEVLALYQTHYRIKRLYHRDILEENPRFKKRGLSYLVEKVYHLKTL